MYLREIGNLFWQPSSFEHLANKLAQELTVVGIVSEVTSQIQTLKWESKKGVEIYLFTSAYFLQFLMQAVAL